MGDCSYCGEEILEGEAVYVHAWRDGPVMHAQCLDGRVRCLQRVAVHPDNPKNVRRSAREALDGICHAWDGPRAAA